MGVEEGEEEGVEEGEVEEGEEEGVVGKEEGEEGEEEGEDVDEGVGKEDEDEEEDRFVSTTMAAMARPSATTTPPISSHDHDEVDEEEEDESMFLLHHNKNHMTFTVDAILADPVRIILAVILVDLIAIVLARQHLAGKVILEWYQKFTLGAFLSDVGSIVFGVLLSLLLFKYVFPKGWFTLPHFLLTVVSIQLIHDLTFSMVIKYFPRGQNVMMDMFKKYVNENGWKILLVDASMMVGSVLLLWWMMDIPSPIVWTIFAFTVYIAQFLIYGG